MMLPRIKYSMHNLICDVNWCAWAEKLWLGCQWYELFLLHQFALASYCTSRPSFGRKYRIYFYKSFLFLNLKLRFYRMYILIFPYRSFKHSHWWRHRLSCSEYLIPTLVLLCFFFTQMWRKCLAQLVGFKTILLKNWCWLSFFCANF